MNKNSIIIAKTTLAILKSKSWTNILIKEIKIKSKVKKFDEIIKNKQDILKEINYYFDYMLSLKCKKIEVSNSKDMIFEVLMTRFDILQLYRKAVLSIFNSFKKNPKHLLFLLPNLIESVILMLSFAKISTKGISGQLKIKGMIMIYIFSFFVWMKDENTSLEKTMTAVDEYLEKAGKFLKYLN